MRHGLVVMSGGQDSVTCLGVALRDCAIVTAVSFMYGQKHDVEVEIAREICERRHVQHLTVDLSPVLGFMRSSALINHGDVNAAHPILTNLPASFVPVRNALFLTTAYGIAIELHCDIIYTGVCQTDYSGYPDCREQFISALNHALDLGYDSQILIETPLMHLTKAQTFALAEEVGILDTVLADTMTCYNGISMLNEWGKGCRECPACQLRAKGWEEYKAAKAA